MMLRRLTLAVGAWACLVAGGRAQEPEPAPPPPNFPPPAFATRPRGLVPVPPDGPCPACGHTVPPGPCWRRLLRWMTYRPLPTQCHGSYFCSSCRGGGGSACGCRQPLPCCTPQLFAYFLDKCPNCAPPIGVGPTHPPVFPAPGDPPLAEMLKEKLPPP